MIKKFNGKIIMILLFISLISNIGVLNSKIAFAENNNSKVNSTNELRNSLDKPIEYSKEQVESQKSIDAVDFLMKFLEGFYYIVGILALLAIKNSSQQNKLLQQEINDNLKISNQTFQREIALATVKKCEEFASVIIPLISDVTALIIKENIEISDKKILKEAAFNNKEEYEKLLQTNAYKDTLYSTCFNAANQLEAYAMYFTEKICDENIAFKATGQVLVDMIPYLYPYILEYRIKYRSNGYSNLIKLYLIWANRMETENIEIQTAELEKQEHELQQKKEHLEKLKSSKGNGIEELKPIGSGS